MDDEPEEAESCVNRTKMYRTNLIAIQSISLPFETIISKRQGIAVSFFCSEIRRLKIGY